MLLRRFQIYVVEFSWKNRVDRRPVLIVSPQWYLDDYLQDDVLVVPLSAAGDLWDRHRHFLIESSSAEFAATGLKKTCYAAMDYMTPVARDELSTHVGELRGGLAEEFRNFLLGFFR